MFTCTAHIQEARLQLSTEPLGLTISGSAQLRMGGKCLRALICLCRYHIYIILWTWNRTLGIQGEGGILTKVQLEGSPGDEGLGKTERTPEVVQVLSLIADSHC